MAKLTRREFIEKGFKAMAALFIAKTLFLERLFATEVNSTEIKERIKVADNEIKRYYSIKEKKSKKVNALQIERLNESLTEAKKLKEHFQQIKRDLQLLREDKKIEKEAQKLIENVDKRLKFLNATINASKHLIENINEIRNFLYSQEETIKRLEKERFEKGGILIKKGNKFELRFIEDERDKMLLSLFEGLERGEDNSTQIISYFIRRVNDEKEALEKKRVEKLEEKLKKLENQKNNVIEGINNYKKLNQQEKELLKQLVVGTDYNINIEQLIDKEKHLKQDEELIAVFHHHPKGFNVMPSMMDAILSIDRLPAIVFGFHGNLIRTFLCFCGDIFEL